MAEEIKKYDDKENLVYWKFFDGYEEWYKYDENNNQVYCKNSIGDKWWYKYNKYNEQITATEQEYNEIEFRKKEKEYLSRTKCSRFEIMEI